MPDELSPEDEKRAKEGILNLWIPRAEFDALLEESGLPDKIADVYFRRWQEQGEYMPGSDEDRARVKERVEKNIKPVADKLREYLPQTLYYAAGLLAHQLTVSREEPQTKARARSLVNLFFFRDDRVVVDGRGGREPEIDVTDEQCRLMAVNYETLLKKWHNARGIRHKNRTRNWRVLVKDEYPDLPDDLLNRLDDLDPYTRKPSAIAHEHVARLAGIPSNKYSTSTLGRLRRRGKNAINRNENLIDDE